MRTQKNGKQLPSPKRLTGELGGPGLVQCPECFAAVWDTMYGAHYNWHLANPSFMEWVAK
jgi:hypothetical protein